MGRRPETIAAIAIFPILFWLGCSHLGPAATSASEADKGTSDVIPKEWLKKKTTVEQAEKENLVSDKGLGPKPIPFGFINQEWEKFKSRIQSGDELWEFSSPEESWKRLAGRAGFCILRQGRIVDAIITLMN